MRLEEASSLNLPEVNPGTMRFELASASSCPPSTSGRLHLSAGQGRLVLHSTRMARQQTLRRGRNLREPLTLGSLACLARAALEQHGKKAPLKVLGRSTRRALQGIPESARRLLAGALAGAVSKTATAPLETVRMQMMTGKKGSVLDVVRSTWAQGGVLGFFSGNEADVLRTMPSKALELASFDLYKRLLTPSGQQRGPGGIATSVAGGLAGITSTVAMFPLETARTRLAVNSGQYKNLLDCLSSLAREEGFGAWYKGLNASLIGVIPYTAVRLGMYDGLKWAHTRVTGSTTIPAQNSMLYGALAAVTSATVSFPLEVVRRRMMMGTASGNTLTAIVAIAQNEGVASLYKGVVLTWVKQAPQYAVTFCCYDLTKAWLAGEKEREKEKEGTAVAVPTLQAGTVK